MPSRRIACGTGWLQIEARGGSGVRYAPCDEADVPQDARAVLTADPRAPS